MSIRVNNLSKKYMNSKTMCLNNINAVIPKGKFGLLGENGAGKTSLLKTIATITPIQKGNILVNGLDLSRNTHKIRKEIGYLPQKFNFFENLTVYETLDYIALLKNVKSEYRDTEIKQLIGEFNLQDKMYSKVESLSGGMKQRLAIAQAIIGNSNIIILDEPTVGLDPNERLRFRNIISKLSDNKTVIISTHIISDISVLCDNIGIMKKGKLLYCGSVEDLLESVDGKVYIDTLKTDEIVDLNKYRNLMSITRKKNIVEVRFIMEEENNAEFTSVSPTLEDAYFFWINSM